MTLKRALRLGTTALSRAVNLDAGLTFFLTLTLISILTPVDIGPWIEMRSLFNSPGVNK